MGIKAIILIFVNPIFYIDESEKLLSGQVLGSGIAFYFKNQIAFCFVLTIS